MVLNQIRHSQEQAREEMAPKHQPPKGASLDKILSDPKKNELFGAMLQQAGGQNGFGERLLSGKLIQGELEQAEEFRQTFLEKMEKIEKAKESMTPERLKSLAQNSPELQKIMNLAGIEKSSKAILHQFEMVAISDPDRFELLCVDLDKLNEYESGAYKKMDATVERLCKEYNIDSSSYGEILMIEDPKKREKALQKAVGDGYGRMKKIANWFTGGKMAKNKMDAFIAESETKDNEETDTVGNNAGREHILETIEAMNHHLGEVGTTLASTISENQDLRHAISHAATNKDLEGLKREPSAKFENARKEPKLNDMESAWESYKEKNTPDGKKWDEVTDKDTILDNFMTEYKKKKKKEIGGGFWGAIWATLFDTKADAHKSELKK